MKFKANFNFTQSNSDHTALILLHKLNSDLLPRIWFQKSKGRVFEFSQKKEFMKSSIAWGVL